ncbi:hypothetical protein [Roseobacter sp.]|uniref:hypothetical protein n=1 Tax=Roseobacter sp. TaxID=1907202 RepID=UPI0029665921|nr:hypothetical protein [Roseobacter sp.]MDW3184483.1 hypothetical protein [Roseobacter sp.]
MIPFLTEVLELAAAGLLLAGAMPFLKNSEVFRIANFSMNSKNVGDRFFGETKGDTQ